MTDEFKNMLRSMDDLLHPYRSIQEEVERLLKPQLEFQDQISRLLERYDHVRVSLDAIENPAAKLQRVMQRNLYATDTIRDQLRELLSPQLEAQKQFDDLLRPQRWMQDQLAHLLKPQADFLASVRAQLEPVALVRGHIADLIEPLNQYLSEFQGLEIDVDSAGNVFIDDDEVLAGEISAVTSSFHAAPDSVQQFVESFVTWLSQLTPRLRQAVLFLLLPYIISVVATLTTPLYQEWWREHVSADPRVAKKEILLEASELYDREELARYRFVYATRLHVRAEGNMNAEIIDNLPLGKSVLIVRRQKAWTEIEYLNDSTGEAGTGWVYSRYLHKFER
jgi:hypothetical protein